MLVQLLLGKNTVRCCSVVCWFVYFYCLSAIWSSGMTLQCGSSDGDVFSVNKRRLCQAVFIFIDVSMQGELGNSSKNC